MDWRLWALVGVIFSLATLALITSDRTHNLSLSYQNHNKQQESTHSPPSDDKRPVGLEKTPEVGSADERIAFYTAILTIFTGLLFVSTTGLWYIAVRQLKETRGFFQAEKRQWIGPPRIEAEVYDKVVQFNFFLENTGNTPAISVHMGAELRSNVVNDFGNLERMHDKFCRDEPNRGTRYTIIPRGILLATSSRQNEYLSIEIDPDDYSTRTVKIISGSIFYGPRINKKLCRTDFHAPVEIKDGNVRVERVWAENVT